MLYDEETDSELNRSIRKFNWNTLILEHYKWFPTCVITTEMTLRWNCTNSYNSQAIVTSKGYFSGPRYFLSYDGKRLEKIESQTHFSIKNKTEMRENHKKGEIWTSPKIVAQPARELFSVQWGAAVACCRSPNSTNFYQINFFRASFPRKQGPSVTSEPTYLRAPSGLFRRLFWSFLRTFCAFVVVVVVVVVVVLKNEFEIRLSSVFFLLPRPPKYPLNCNWC